MHDTEWAALEAGLVQRAELLDAVLTDLYDERRLIAEGLLPPEVVFGHDGFVRAADRIRLPGPHQLFLAGVDLVRGSTGEWMVLGDRTQAPSGAGYAMENRRVVSRLLPGLYRDSRIQRLAPFFHAMRLGLQEIAPAGSEAPHVVLLTPGSAERDGVRPVVPVVAAGLSAGRRQRPDRARRPGVGPNLGPARAGRRDPAPGRCGVRRSP